jgi:general secretion pathway protein L
MPLTLLLRLPAPGQEETEWLSIDASGASAGPRQRGPLSLAAAVARGQRVVALAPATQVLLAEPELPPGSGARLARAVPFALEEQLTEDIDQLFFAIGARSVRGATPVAVVSRAVMQGWIDALKEAGIEPASMLPDISLLPQNPGQTVLWLEGERLAVRRPGMLPFVVELSPVADALAIAGVIADPSPQPTEPKALESALLYVTREDWAVVQEQFEGLVERFESLKIQLLPDGPLPWLARELADTDAVNLLQNEYVRATDYGAQWRQWRLAAALALAFLVVHVGAQALQIRQAHKRTAAIDGEIAAVFASAMPTEKMQDPRRQMQARLDRIHRSGAGPEYFLRTLQVLGDAVGTLPKTSVDALSFHGQTLDLKVTAPSIAALSQLSQAVGREGLAAEIQSSTPVAAGVEAHLQVRTATARVTQ